MADLGASAAGQDVEGNGLEGDIERHFCRKGMVKEKEKQWLLGGILGYGDMKQWSGVYSAWRVSSRIMLGASPKGIGKYVFVRACACS